MKIVVIKCGGSVLEELSDSFFTSLRNLMKDGYKPVLVHGGGPAINRMLTLLNVDVEFHNGLRKTSKQVLQTVELVLSGQTNRQLVKLLSDKQFDAVGVNGSDGKLLIGKLINKELLGYVGEITSVNQEMIKLFLDKDLIPVLTPIAVSEEGDKLNINADHAASAVAKALQAERCLFVTNVSGVLVDGECLPQLTLGEMRELIDTGKIYGGMIPKVQSAASVVKEGGKGVTIVSGTQVFYEEKKWLGTNIVMEELNVK